MTMNELEKRFLTLGCGFFHRQAKMDFIEVHHCTDYYTIPIAINKSHIISVEGVIQVEGRDAMALIRTTDQNYHVTESYEQIIKMLS